MMRSVENIDTFFQPLEEAINQNFVPALTGRGPGNPDEWKLVSLPVRYGELNIINRVTSADGEYHASQKMRKPLKNMIIKQKESFSKPQLQSIRASLRQDRNQKIKDMAGQIRECLPPRKQRMMDLLSWERIFIMVNGIATTRSRV